MAGPQWVRRAWVIVRPAVGFLVLLGAWLSATIVVPPLYLPTPGDVAAAGLDLIRKGMLPAYVVDSLRHLVVGATIGIAIGVPMGLAIGVSSLAAKFFFPLLNFFQSLGGIVWLPLFIVWFGLNERTIYAAIIYTVLFPTAFNTMIGVRTVPAVFSQAVATLGGSRWRIVRDVLVPGALPNIVTGVRLGLAYGWRALVAAEIVVGANGLGFMIFDAQTFNEVARILLGMIVIGALWVVLDAYLLRPLERDTIERWNLVRT
jgi:NitT/TauT family transport system permease protein/taurine transport system permease protein